MYINFLNMDILNMCRICLVENVKMYSLVNTKLQDIYEKLTAMPLQTEDGKPLLVCYLCRATLQTCYRLHIKCIRSNELLNQMLESNQIKLTLLKDSRILTVKHPAVHLSYVPTIDDKVSHEKNIKEEAFIEDTQKNIAIEELSVEYTGLDNIKTESIDRNDVDETDDSVHIVPATGTSSTSYAEVHIEYDIKQENNIRDAEEDIRNNDAVIENDLESKYSNNVLLKPVQFVSNRTEVECGDTGSPDAEKLEVAVKAESIQNNTSNEIETEATLENNSQCLVKVGSLKNNSEKSIHSSEKSYKCGNCGKCFKEKQNLKQHNRLHAGEKPYICDTCKKCFSLKHNLVKHIRLHTGCKPYKCDICEKRFSENSYLTQHVRTHSDDNSYKCYMCGLCFSTKSCLTEHIHVHTREKPFTCEYCDKSFNLKPQLTDHLQLHKVEKPCVKPYKCDLCEKYFNRKSNLTQHIRTHTGEKPYKCHVCEKRYHQKRYLVQHMCTHTGEKPYKCDRCEKRFINKHNLSQHVRIHDIEKPYKCDVCFKGFHLKKILMRHFHVHTGEKPYKCDLCDKQFNRKSQLTQHSRIHSG